MITIENLINNNEWYIEPSEAKDFVKNGNLLSYKICNIELGKIRRWESKEKKVLQLKETINYKFLSNQNSKYVREEYVKYCKEQKNLIDKPNRSPEIFINLYNKILKD